MDHTDSATLVIFHKEASLLFNMTCADMIDAAQRVSVLEQQYIIVFKNTNINFF
jgi:hypothetical protein